MSERRFDIVFAGKLINGADLMQVKANLQKLFGLDAEAVEKLFTGGPVVIKKNLDRPTASKYQQAMTQAGASIQLQLHQGTATTDTETPAAADPTSPAADDNGFGLLPVGSDLLSEAERKPVAAVEVDTSHLKLDASAVFDTAEPSFPLSAGPDDDPRYPGHRLDDYATSLELDLDMEWLSAMEHVATASDIAIDHLSLAAAGELLAPPAADENIQSVDLAAVEQWSLAEAGSDLLNSSERSNTEARDIDTSALSIDPG